MLLVEGKQHGRDVGVPEIQEHRAEAVVRCEQGQLQGSGREVRAEVAALGDHQIGPLLCPRGEQVMGLRLGLSGPEVAEDVPVEGGVSVPLPDLARRLLDEGIARPVRTGAGELHPASQGFAAEYEGGVERDLVALFMGRAGDVVQRGHM
ncbi:hypothetical protein RB199_15795 [Streptomyces libani]